MVEMGRQMRDIVWAKSSVSLLVSGALTTESGNLCLALVFRAC